MTRALNEESLSMILDISRMVLSESLQASMSFKRIWGSVGRFLEVLILSKSEPENDFIRQYRGKMGPIVCLKNNIQMTAICQTFEGVQQAAREAGLAKSRCDPAWQKGLMDMEKGGCLPGTGLFRADMGYAILSKF